MMSVVICKLPKAGLGNQLFPLMHAYVFAKLNDLPVIVTGYHQLKIGPYLRMEKSKRRYNGYFTFQKNILREYVDIWKIKRLMKTNETVFESKVQKLTEDNLKGKVFVFEKMTTYHDYFQYLKEYRQEVINTLYSILKPWLIEKINNQPKPVVGIHFRMGDFRKLNGNEIYNSGHVRTPEDFFINTINSIRKINGKDLPVSIFTDGYKNELVNLLKLKDVKMVEGNPDIIDMLLLSKSQVIIPTHGSTFSIWAAFLSDASLISYFKYPNLIRPDKLSEKIYEGVLNVNDELLINNITSIS